MGGFFTRLLCICGGSFIAEVTVSGTPAISMLWSHSNELLHILVPLLQMIGVVCSFMCCFFTQLHLWVPCTFPLPVSFFMVAYILFPACNRRGLSSLCPLVWTDWPPLLGRFKRISQKHPLLVLLLDWSKISLCCQKPLLQTVSKHNSEMF